ncbi:MAG: hypothetical protein PHR82_10330, partial [Endomicrobiaceae bacterium]|nr:hypothetical protein [Endomicrobiaceae bacterium]
SVLEYTKDMGYTSIPGSNKNALLYRYGEMGYRAPSLAALAEYVQFEQGTVFVPSINVANEKISDTSGVITTTKTTAFSTTAVTDVNKIFRYEGLGLVSTASLSSKGIEGTDKLLADPLNGLTKPDMSSKEVQAVMAISGNNLDGVAKLLGYADFNEAKRISDNEIASRCIEKMATIAREGGKSADSLMAVDLMSVAGGILIVAKANEASSTTALKELQTFKPKNISTVTQLLKDAYKKDSVASGDMYDFVIDISKLQKTVTEKISYTTEERDRILGVLIDDRNGEEARNKILALMKLSDIRAVAQSA